MKKTNELYELYNYYYMISLYNLIHEYNCEWEFFNINDKNFLNGTNLKYDEFARNNYLVKYQDQKTGLARDILQNGMFFPYFIYGSKDEQPDENTIRLALGKHRLYSKLLYQAKEKTNIDKKFLFIYVPNSFSIDRNHRRPSKNPNYHFYILNSNNKPIIKNDKFASGRALMRYFDITGGRLSNEIINSKLATNQILNDESLFQEFINAPLDENNILFKMYL